MMSEASEIEDAVSSTSKDLEKTQLSADNNIGPKDENSIEEESNGTKEHVDESEDKETPCNEENGDNSSLHKDKTEELGRF